MDAAGRRKLVAAILVALFLLINLIGEAMGDAQLRRRALGCLGIMLASLLALFLLLWMLVPTPAPAAPVHHRVRHRILRAVACIETGDVLRPVCGMGWGDAVAMTDQQRTARRPIVVRRGRRNDASEVLPHPRGCPARLFCGCGAAVKVFGAPIRSLWLAANWFRFPRTRPAPGMVAVRRHHVFVLEAEIEGGIWRVYDANSGRHLTRRHARSIAGYTIVDPHGGA